MRFSIVNKLTFSFGIRCRSCIEFFHFFDFFVDFISKNHLTRFLQPIEGRENGRPELPRRSDRSEKIEERSTLQRPARPEKEKPEPVEAEKPISRLPGKTTCSNIALKRCKMYQIVSDFVNCYHLTAFGCFWSIKSCPMPSFFSKQKLYEIVINSISPSLVRIFKKKEQSKKCGNMARRC